MRQKLKNILMKGSFILAGCSTTRSPSILTKKDFERATWIEAPYRGEIWSSYLGESVSRTNQNWNIYQSEVANKNEFRYVEKEGKRYIVGMKGKSFILLPDLDEANKRGHGYVVSGKDTIRNKRPVEEGPY